MKNIELYYGDCLNFFNLLPTCNFKADLFIIDPPYGSTPLSWDKKIDFNLLWEIIYQILKPNGVVCVFGQEPFSSFVRMSNIKNYKYDWYWQKERLTNVFQVKNRPGKVIETISVFYKKQCEYNSIKTKHNGKKVVNRINGTFSKSIARNIIKPIEFRDDSTRHPIQILKINRENLNTLKHPTQKPVLLLEHLIKSYTNRGDIVFDPCMGSGSTGIACLNTGRKFIGIELDKNYFEIAKKRIEEHEKIKKTILYPN